MAESAESVRLWETRVFAPVFACFGAIGVPERDATFLNNPLFSAV